VFQHRHVPGQNAGDFPSALEKAFGCDDVLVIERYLKGIELTGSVIGNEELTALPVVEIIPDEKYDFLNITPNIRLENRMKSARPGSAIN